MARIRTIKPEFWEDEKIGALSHGARLLFLCCLNLSDDEGLLRWNAFYLASNAFTYDEIKIETVEKWMNELVDNELIFVYIAGKTKQKIGHVINFSKHQRVDKSQPSKFTPPNYQDIRVKDMIYKRDKGVCQICGGLINEAPRGLPFIDSNSRKCMMSCDHKIPRSKGGSDFFSNLQASHLYCNQCKCNKIGEYVENEVDADSNNDSKNYSKNDSKNYSKNDSKNDSTTEKESKDKSKKKVNTSMEEDEEFERFWNLYSKKVGKKDKIKTKFLKLSKADRAKIFETLPAYIAATPDATYRKNPETYLNNESWNDEIIPRNETRQSTASRPSDDHSQYRDYRRSYPTISDF